MIRYLYLGRNANEIDEEIDILHKLDYRQDYENNKYNVMEEDEKVRIDIINELGFSNKDQTRMLETKIKNIKNGSIHEYQYYYSIQSKSF